MCCIVLNTLNVFPASTGFTGHGVGTSLHAKPVIFHHYSDRWGPSNVCLPRLRPHACIALCFMSYGVVCSLTLVYILARCQGKMVEGQTFTIEPMITMQGNGTKRFSDGSIHTVDGSWAAQFEHTLLVTKSGVEILTLA
jgi:methionine aminopeptidase